MIWECMGIPLLARWHLIIEMALKWRVLGLILWFEHVLPYNQNDYFMVIVGIEITLADFKRFHWQ